MPQHKNPCSRGHIIYNFVRTFLGYHYYTLGLTEPCPEVDKIFKRNTLILHSLPKKLPPLGVGVHKIYNFLSPYPTDATYQIW